MRDWKKYLPTEPMMAYVPRPFAGKWPTRWYLRVDVYARGIVKRRWVYLGKPNKVALRTMVAKLEKLPPGTVVAFWVVEFDRAGACWWLRWTPEERPDNVWRYISIGGRTSPAWLLYHALTRGDGFAWIANCGGTASIAHPKTNIKKLRVYVPAGPLPVSWQLEYRRQVKN